MKKLKYSLAVLGFCFLAAGCAQQTTKAGVSGLQRIHFDYDKAFIKAEYEGALKENAQWLSSHAGANVVIEGHCDERGTNEYNIALGDRRANSAKRYLNNLGVGADRMSTVSYGEERSLASCSNESCWWQNRRAEFVR